MDLKTVHFYRWHSALSKFVRHLMVLIDSLIMMWYYARNLKFYGALRLMLWNALSHLSVSAPAGHGKLVESRRACQTTKQTMNGNMLDYFRNN